MSEDSNQGAERRVPLRSGAAEGATRLVSSLSRRLGRGSGSTIGGRVGLALDPSLLRRLGAGRSTVLVSGTNGKTTTTRMLAEAVGTAGPVATSRAGANMDAGLVAALASSGRGARAVLEVDEAHLPSAIEALSPDVVVLLNLSRDQLDRVSEVRLLAERWRVALDGRDLTVVANADDPLVVHAASGAARTIFVATASRWHDDAYHCPRCNQRIEYDDAGWRCQCGFARPPVSAWTEDDQLVLVSGATVALRPGVPGRFNVANAAMALLAAAELGIELGEGARAVAGLSEVEGRFADTELDGRSVRLLLAKNPAGFTELLELLADGDAPVVVAINARIADGHDPSWLWDVPFELLAGRQVIATGERAGDLTVRLVHAGATVTRVDDQRAAVAAAPAGDLEYVGNYTAFQELRAIVGAAPAPSAAVTAAVRPARAPVVVARTGLSTVRIVVVHPDLLGTYGDGGNATVLAGRASWRGIPAEIVAATSDRPLPEGADLYLLGGGEDGPQLASTDALRSGALERAVEHGAVVLAVCAGYQILGHAFPAPDGSEAPGLGLLDVTTARTPRAVGEILLDGPCGPITGFENHGGRTARADGLAPFGRVVAGVGNGDGTDGAIAGRIFATYCHGPLLARNPQFADALLELATGMALSPIDDPAAEALHAERVDRGSRERAQRVARGR